MKDNILKKMFTDERFCVSYTAPTIGGCYEITKEEAINLLSNNPRIVEEEEMKMVGITPYYYYKLKEFQNNDSYCMATTIKGKMCKNHALFKGDINNINENDFYCAVHGVTDEV